MKTKYIYTILLTLAFTGTPFVFAATTPSPIALCEAFLIPYSHGNKLSGSIAQAAYELAQSGSIAGKKESTSGKQVASTSSDIEVEIITIGTVNFIKHTRIEKSVKIGNDYHTHSQYFVDFSRSSFQEFMAFAKRLSEQPKNAATIAGAFEKAGLILKDQNGDTSAQQLFRFFETVDKLVPADHTEERSFGRFASENLGLKYTKHASSAGRKQTATYTFNGALIKRITTINIETNAETHRYEADFTATTDLKSIIVLSVVMKRFSLDEHRLIARKENAIVSQDNAFYRLTRPRIGLFLLNKQND